MLAPCPTPKLEDHPSSAVRGCLFNLFTATLHIGGRSSIRNLRTRHAVVTDPHSWHILTYFQKFSWLSVPVHRDSLLTLLTTFLFLLGSIGSLFLLKTVSCPHMQLIHGRQVTDSSSLGKIRTLYNSYCIFPKPDLWLT